MQINQQEMHLYETLSVFFFLPYSEYLEVHQTELDKLMSLMKDMKRNSRLVRNDSTFIYVTSRL